MLEDGEVPGGEAERVLSGDHVRNRCRSPPGASLPGTVDPELRKADAVEPPGESASGQGMINVKWQHLLLWVPGSSQQACLRVLFSLKA